MPPIRYTSDSVVGAALSRLGIVVHQVTADHSPLWKSNTRGRLTTRFGYLFKKTAGHPKVVIAVDAAGLQYVVTKVDDIEKVWRRGKIDYCFTMPADMFETIRGDIALHAVPELNPA